MTQRRSPTFANAAWCSETGGGTREEASVSGGMAAGFIGLATLMVMLAAMMVGLFARLRKDVSDLPDRLTRLEAGQGELRERMARLEGRVDRLRAAVVSAVRRDAV